MSKEKKIICVLTGIIIGILLSVAFIGNPAGAKSVRKTNTDTAVRWVIRHYDEYHIHPVTAAAILNGESRAMTDKNNHGRPYGMVGRHYYDIKSGTKAFCKLIRYSKYYGDAWEYFDWQDQLSIIARHGYCEGSGYLSYLHSIVNTYDLEQYEDELLKHLKKTRQKEKAEEKRLIRLQEEALRKARQKEMFILRYDMTLLPWQIITDPDFIKGGTIQIGFTWCDVVGTEKGIGNTIKIGYRPALFGIKTYLGEVVENAVG